MSPKTEKILERAVAEEKRVSSLLSDSLELTSEKRQSAETYAMELRWVINAGFRSRTARQINSEIARIVREIEGRETWTEVYQNAVIKVTALQFVLNLSDNEMKSRLIPERRVANAHQKSVTLTFHDLTPPFTRGQRIILDKLSGDEFELVGMQTAKCPFCDSENDIFDLKHISGKSSDGKDLAGMHYPFAVEIQEFHRTCKHYYFAAGGVYPKNYMVFQGSPYDLPEQKAKDAEAIENFFSVRDMMGLELA